MKKSTHPWDASACNACTAYRLNGAIVHQVTCKAKPFLDLIPKLEQLLRFHRRHIFDQPCFVGDRHCRALNRLCATKTYAFMCKKRADHAHWLEGEAILRSWA